MSSILWFVKDLEKKKNSLFDLLICDFDSDLLKIWIDVVYMGDTWSPDPPDPTTYVDGQWISIFQNRPCWLG